MATEALELRSPYFTNVSLNAGSGFCIDDRSSERPAYIKLPGGILFFASNLAIMRCLNDETPISRLEAVKVIASALKEKDYSFGVHSDDSSPDIEKPEGPVGCGYLAKGPEVMKLIGVRKDDITEELENLRLDLFNMSTEDDREQTFDAYAHVEEDGLFFAASPREVARTAMNLGAPYMEVRGQHDPKAIGIINLRSGTTLDTSKAAEGGYPAYNYDGWAFSEVAETITPLSGYDLATKERAAAIDAVATFMLLGVQEIYVRR